MLPIAAALAALAVPASAKPTLEPYGFVRFDAIFDDSKMNSAQSPLWVEDETPATEDDSELSLHPRLTRFGVNLAPEDVGQGATLSGKIEIDFQNGGRESRQTPRMRHGYLQIASGSWELLAGQTWDLVSPLLPAPNADALMWNAGNTGDRRPQVRFTTRTAAGAGKARFAAAVGMPNAVDAQDLDQDGELDGFDAAVPAVQALAEVDLPAVLLGGWVHWAREQVGAGANEENYDAMLAGGHARIPLGKKARISGEAFFGRNLSDVRGGIGQSVNLTQGEEIAAMGGWGELGVDVTPKYSVAAGATIDRPDSDDLSDGARQRNLVIYLVQTIAPLPRVKVGVEYLHWRTDRVGRDTADANRVDAHLTLGF